MFVVSPVLPLTFTPTKSPTSAPAAAVAVSISAIHDLLADLSELNTARLALLSSQRNGQPNDGVVFVRLFVTGVVNRDFSVKVKVEA